MAVQQPSRKKGTSGTCFCFEMKLPRWRKWQRIHLRLLLMQETWFNPWIRKIPWRRKWQPTPVFLPWTEEPGELQSMGLQRVSPDSGLLIKEGKETTEPREWTEVLSPVPGGSYSQRYRKGRGGGGCCWIRPSVQLDNELALARWQFSTRQER